MENNCRLLVFNDDCPGFDRTLLRESRAFLRFFRLSPSERKLDEVERSGFLDFDGPERE